MNLDYRYIFPQPLSTSLQIAPIYRETIPQMKLNELPIYQSCVDQNLTVGNIAALFDNNKEWPGVIITANDNFMGMLSRQRCFEVLGRPFGIEIFSKKTILEFYRSYGCANLLLDADTSIQDAVKSALNRERSMLYDPIIVRIGTNQYGLVNMHVLLLAQCDLLENLYTEMQQLSVRDPLTNLNNRRGFFEAAEPEIVSSQTNHTDLSALMIDIDNFKITNDVYGHFVGDQVLRAVADECQKALRQTDLLGRFGGEEFIALLPNTPIDTAAVIAERLRQKIENLVVYVNGFEVSVTISLGVCHFKDAHRSLDNLLTLADQAMYGAKAAGRNQVMVWDHNLAYMMRKEIGKKELPENYTGIWAKNFRIDAARIYDETIEGWAKALEMRDKETEGHAQRVVNMTLELARRTGFNDMELVEIRRGALLHDIGKIAIPDPILFKPGPLTDEEWEVMRKHPIYAFELLSPITYLQKSMDIPYCHHEHWDGTGYPRGLRGEEIPLTARIFTIVDVWDALCTQRCYRDAWKPEDVRNFIVEQSGKLLDPNITPVFLKMLDESSDSIEKNLLDVAFSNQIPQ